MTEPAVETVRAVKYHANRGSPSAPSDSLNLIACPRSRAATSNAATERLARRVPSVRGGWALACSRALASPTRATTRAQTSGSTQRSASVRWVPTGLPRPPVGEPRRDGVGEDPHVVLGVSLLARRCPGCARRVPHVAVALGPAPAHGLLARDDEQPRVEEQPQVVAGVGLAHVELARHLGGAQLGAGEQREHLQAQRVRGGPQVTESVQLPKTCLAVCRAAGTTVKHFFGGSAGRVSRR